MLLSGITPGRCHQIFCELCLGFFSCLLGRDFIFKAIEAMKCQQLHIYFAARFSGFCTETEPLNSLITYLFN